MKIVFWSPVHGQAATTSNLLTVAITSVLNNKYKNLITQSHYNLNNFERPIIGTSIKELSEQFADVGVDALARFQKTIPLNEEIIENCCISLLSQRLNLLPGTTMLNEELFEKEMISAFPSILKASEEYHDIVFVDANSGRRNKITNKILEEADLIVVNHSQNISVIEDFFNNYSFDEKKTLYLIGNYNYQSKYNLRNLINSYKQFNKSNLAAIPYNVEYLDAQSSGEAIKFLVRNQNCDKYDSNYYFIKTIKESSNLILNKMNAKKKIGRRYSR